MKIQTTNGTEQVVDNIGLVRIKELPHEGRYELHFCARQDSQLFVGDYVLSEAEYPVPLDEVKRALRVAPQLFGLDAPAHCRRYGVALRREQIDALKAELDYRIREDCAQLFDWHPDDKEVIRKTRRQRSAMSDEIDEIEIQE
jgi:hypothetical protein